MFHAILPDHLKWVRLKFWVCVIAVDWLLVNCVQTFYVRIAEKKCFLVATLCSMSEPFHQKKGKQGKTWLLIKPPPKERKSDITLRDDVTWKWRCWAVCRALFFSCRRLVGFANGRSFELVLAPFIAAWTSIFGICRHPGNLQLIRGEVSSCNFKLSLL